MSRERITENPFYVLGLRPECSRADLEREGQKLLALLELSVESVKTYRTPLGPMPRTADRVRKALAELRDPQKRLLHELWAQLPATEPEPPAAAAPGLSDSSDASDGGDGGEVPGPWPDAREALGFGARR
jgi:hypothetical protein